MRKLISAVCLTALVLVALLVMAGGAAAHPRCVITSGTTQVLANGQSEGDPAYFGIRQKAAEHSPVIHACPGD